MRGQATTGTFTSRDELIGKVKAQRAAGVRVTQIARQCGTSMNSVTYILKRS